MAGLLRLVALGYGGVLPGVMASSPIHPVMAPAALIRTVAWASASGAARSVVVPAVVSLFLVAGFLVLARLIPGEA